jgi:hypothetical protein
MPCRASFKLQGAIESKISKSWSLRGPRAPGAPRWEMAQAWRPPDAAFSPGVKRFLSHCTASSAPTTLANVAREERAGAQARRRPIASFASFAL